MYNKPVTWSVIVNHVQLPRPLAHLLHRLIQNSNGGQDTGSVRLGHKPINHHLVQDHVSPVHVVH